MIEKTTLPREMSLAEAVNAIFGQDDEMSTEENVEKIFPLIQFCAETLFAENRRIVSVNDFIEELNRFWIDPDFKIRGYKVVNFTRQLYNLKSGRFFSPTFVTYKFTRVRLPDYVFKVHHRKPRYLGGTNDERNLTVDCSRERHYAFHIIFDTKNGAMSGDEVVKYAGLAYRAMRTIFFDEQGRLLKIGEVIPKIASAWGQGVEMKSNRFASFSRRMAG